MHLEYIKRVELFLDLPLVLQPRVEFVVLLFHLADIDHGLYEVDFALLPLMSAF